MRRLPEPFRRQYGALVVGLALWYTGLVGAAGAATITEFPIPTADSDPLGITAGLDGALWFAKFNASKIGRIVPDSAAALTNLTTRVLVQTGGDVMIAGLAIAGHTVKRVLIRGLGPTLGLPPFDVPGALADPVVQLFAEGGIVPLAQSDTWMVLDPLCGAPIQLCEGPAAITATGLAPPQDAEAALLVTLPLGAYTAILSGAGGTTGGLVDVFEASTGAGP